MDQESEVEVISINRATEIRSGNLVYQVSFGSVGTPIEGLAPPSVKQVVSNKIILFLETGGVSPYLAGSKWKLSIKDDGELSLTKS